MQKLYHHQSPANYIKALARLQKNIRTGRFASYTQQKKWQIWNRLCRYARQLGIKIKAPLRTACFAGGLALACPASAQTFVPQTGTANPLAGVSIGQSTTPTFVDIDGDGDMDAFIGDYYGTVSYFKNTGTATAPVFVLQPDAGNPLMGVNVGFYSSPTFVDIDGDGDMDAFIGSYDGTIVYYKNTGTATAPVFTLQTAGANPLIGVNVTYYAAPTFVDIDGDGDMDAFIGAADGTIRYYKNTGTALAAVFTPQTGAANNPLDGVDVGNLSVPAFVDIDGDGDMDAFIGAEDGTIKYYKNTGTATAPVFTLQTGAANNPLDAVALTYSSPAFVDIDGDGDMDVFIGSYDGTVSFYKNNTIDLPLHLLSFSGGRQAGYNQLQWQTAGEVNTKRFELEMSNDGRNFVELVTVNATGNGNNNYSTSDHGIYNAKVFYRLKMVDADGRFTYSQVIWIASVKGGGVSVYPNPVKDMLNINIGDAKILKTKAGIYGTNGGLLQNILINNNQQQINVQPLAKGVYVIKFADGTVQSFIKE